MSALFRPLAGSTLGFRRRAQILSDLLNVHVIRVLSRLEVLLMLFTPTSLAMMLMNVKTIRVVRYSFLNTWIALKMLALYIKPKK